MGTNVLKFSEPYTKECKSCGQVKPRSAFSKATARPDGLQTQCKDCQRISKKSWDANNPDKRKDNYLRRTYDITLDEYNELFAEQHGCCAICDKHQSEVAKSLHVDHCHDTGEVRGLLCFDCNIGIGKLGDNLEGLEKAVNYLRNK